MRVDDTVARLTAWLAAQITDGEDVRIEGLDRVAMGHSAETMLDPKPGNFAFQDDEVSAVFDWEMASVGDPLADIGWAECNWTTPGSFTNRPGALTPDEAVASTRNSPGSPSRTGSGTAHSRATRWS